MSDPIRRHPHEFFRVLKKMAHTSHWQKSMLFASRGRSVGFSLQLEHYQQVLYAQSVWGRATELIQVLQAMQDDDIEPDAVCMYYLVNGLANVDHGYAADFNVNTRLEGLATWHLALDALSCCLERKFDITASMYNSAIVTCTIPTMNRWVEAIRVYHHLLEEEHAPHENMLATFYTCLIRNKRAVEATKLLRDATNMGKTIRGAVLSKEEATSIEQFPSAPSQTPETGLTAQEEEAWGAQESVALPGDVVPPDAHKVFRPMVWRGLWWRWHAIANKYRPKSSLRKKQLAPKFSPAGIPGWKKK